MFVYCCLFPKDYMFDKDELVLLWMAEGFLYESNGSKSMESSGQECFEDLASRSFFLHLTTDKSLYIMHDLIHDLATSVAGEFFLMLNGKMDVYHRIEAVDKCHHFSFIRDTYGANKMFKALKFGRQLRTFLAMSVTRLENWNVFFIPNIVFVEVLPQLQFLRALSLANYTITEVPPSIGTLKHLRYLNFSNTWIASLPEEVGSLHNLQSLLLSGFNRLSSLPNNFVKLINLCHLDISHTKNLDKMSAGIVGLTTLQNLSKIVIGEVDKISIISNLEGVLHFQGQFTIKGLDKVINVVQAEEVKLQQKRGIYDLSMEWSEIFDDSRNKATEYEVLERLRPFKKLRSLKISYYAGTEFPSWLGDLSFDCLTRLTLRGCRSCTRLPALGHLPSLKELFVGSMDGLERLDFEFLGRFNYPHAVAFPSLVVLKFEHMHSWKEWSTSGGDIVGVFPCVREITMIDCPKLDVVAIKLISSLRDLHVKICSLMVLRGMVGVSPSTVRLTVDDIKGLTQLCEEVMWESEAATHEVVLKEVNIVSCERLKSCNCPSSIVKLKISMCKSLTSLSFPTMDGLVSTLKDLVITFCHKLEISWLVNNFLSSLEFLYLQGLNVRLFPDGCLLHLTRLNIHHCDNLEFIPDDGYGFLPFFCLRNLYITHCKNLKSFPYEHLESLESLVEMEISECPNLDCSFPCGLWPPNLRSLDLGGLKKPVSEWGMQKFPTSLVTPKLWGGENSRGLISFAKAGEDSTSSFLLPSSLTKLCIYDWMELESLSDGLQHLTCLQHLYIMRCSKLRDLPETILPSLSSLSVNDCSPKLIQKCSTSGKYWPIISQIPDLIIVPKHHLSTIHAYK